MYLRVIKFMIFFVMQTHMFINNIDLLKCTEKKNKF